MKSSLYDMQRKKIGNRTKQKTRIMSSTLNVQHESIKHECKVVLLPKLMATDYCVELLIIVLSHVFIVEEKGMAHLHAILEEIVTILK